MQADGKRAALGNPLHDVAPGEVEEFIRASGDREENADGIEAVEVPEFVSRARALRSPLVSNVAPGVGADTDRERPDCYPAGA